MKGVTVLWDRYERSLAYVFVAAFAMLEVADLVLEDLDKYVAPGVRVVVLVLGLVLFMRTIDSRLVDLHVPIEAQSLRDAVENAVQGASRPISLSIVANDGLRYYSLLSELDLPLESVRLALSSSEHAERWHRLRERGLISDLTIKYTSASPAFHYCVVNRDGAVYGAFTSRTQGGMSPTRNVRIDATTKGSREMVEALQAGFEQVWNQASDTMT